MTVWNNNNYYIETDCSRRSPNDLYLFIYFFSLTLSLLFVVWNLTGLPIQWLHYYYYFFFRLINDGIPVARVGRHVWTRSPRDQPRFLIFVLRGAKRTEK